MTAEDGKAVRLAAAMEELSDALIHEDMKGPTNPLDSSRREYRGLQYGPLVEASSRGALVEWLSNERSRRRRTCPPTSATASR